LTDEEGWLEVGRQGLDRLFTTSTAPQAQFCQRTFLQAKTYYFENKEFKKNSTKCLHEQIVNHILTPEFGNDVAVHIKPKRIKSFLKGLAVGASTREKYQKNGLSTRRSQNALLERLDADDLAKVSLALAQYEQEQGPAQ